MSWSRHSQQFFNGPCKNGGKGWKILHVVLIWKTVTQNYWLSHLQMTYYCLPVPNLKPFSCWKLWWKNLHMSVCVSMLVKLFFFSLVPFFCKVSVLDFCMPAGSPWRAQVRKKKKNYTLYIAMPLRSSSSCLEKESHEMRHQIWPPVCITSHIQPNAQVLIPGDEMTVLLVGLQATKGGGGWPHPPRSSGRRGMWARISVRGGRKPSTLLWEDVSSHNKLATRAVKVAWARRADHLAMRAAVTAWRQGSGLWRALALASCRMNPAASSLQRPPASTPTTTKRQRPGWTSSGHVRSLDLRASRSAVPA